MSTTVATYYQYLQCVLLILNIFFQQAICSLGVGDQQDVAGQTKVIWRDPKNQGWKQKTSYRVYIQHRPKAGIIRLKIYEGSVQIIDSGDVIDRGLSGGRVGVFTCSQPKTIWSDMKYTCQDE